VYFRQMKIVYLCVVTEWTKIVDGRCYKIHNTNNYEVSVCVFMFMGVYIIICPNWIILERNMFSHQQHGNGADRIQKMTLISK